MSVRRLAAKFLVLLAAAGCGDSLSSLDGVQSSVREVYHMHLQPDYGFQGKTVKVTVTDMDQDLHDLLANTELYPVEISFGEGTHLKTFTTNDSGQFQIEVAISPLANPGKREPFVIFAVGHQQEEVEARGSFWISKSKDE